jgi:hypothetical protein
VGWILVPRELPRAGKELRNQRRLSRMAGGPEGIGVGRHGSREEPGWARVAPRSGQQCGGRPDCHHAIY